MKPVEDTADRDRCSGGRVGGADTCRGVVGLVWEFLCRVVPIVLVCAVVLAAVVGALWLIGRVAWALGGK